MSDGYAMTQDSATGVDDGLVSWLSFEAFDCIGLDQFLHDFPSTKEPARVEWSGPVSLPQNDQSFFRDFDHKKPAISSQHPVTMDPPQSEFIAVEDYHSFQISPFDLDVEETFELADKGASVCRDSSKDFWLEEMGNQCQVPEGVSSLLATGPLCSSSPEVHEEQDMTLPLYENSSLFEFCLGSITPKLPLEAEKLTPSPATENSRKVKTKEENWNVNDADAKKERRRLQNRTAAKRCRNRKKECIESMLKAMEKAISEKERYQNIVVALKAQVVMLTQELRQHQLHCNLIRNNAPCISSSNSSSSSSSSVHPTISNTRSTIFSPQIKNERFS